MPIQLTYLLGVFVKYALGAVGVIAAVAVSSAQLGLTFIDPGTVFGVAAPLLVIAVAGFFTIRSNVAKIWRENYEAEVAKNKVLADEILEQRELKHNALNEAAALKLELSAERSKPDYTSLNQAMHELGEKIDRLFEQAPPSE